MIKWLLVIIGFMALFTLIIWGVIAYVKILKKDQDDFYNAKYPEEEDTGNKIEK